MAELKLRKQLGRRLSHDELDGNFTALELELEKKANTEDLSNVALSGSYDDLSNTPKRLSEFENDTNFQNDQQVQSAVRSLGLITSNPLQVINGQVTLSAIPLGGLIHNMVIAFIDLTENDLNEDGTLKLDRPYLISEHLGAIVQGNKVLVPVELDGYYVQVSYVADLTT